MVVQSDQCIIKALITGDERVTQQFFFKDCRPLFQYIIKHVFSYRVDYDEFVNEFYLYLMENNAYRLKQFKGRSSIYQWLKIVAIRYFMAKRESMIAIESKEPLIDKAARNTEDDSERRITSKIDVNNLFALMSNKRYVYVIKRLVLEDADPKDVAFELNTNVDNLYNIKKRAIAALVKVALYEAKKNEKEIRK